MEAARRGDVAAFNRLVDAYQSLAYNVAYRTLGQAETAADATQDAFLAAFRGIREFRGASFRAWLLRIVVNTCYDCLRRQRRRPADSLEALVEQEHAGEPLDPSPGPERTALQRETAALIQRLLDELPAEQRLAVVLCDVQGLSYEEAAEALAVPLGTVKSRLARGRAQLRDALAARGELPSRPRRLQSDEDGAPP